MILKDILSPFCFLATLLSPALFSQQAPDAPPAPVPPARVRAVSTHTTVNHGTSYLGVGVEDIDAERAKVLNLKEERGVEIKSVVEDSPAAKAGIKVGDVVLEFNGQRVEGTEQFVRLVRETPAGRSCKLLLSRNGTTQTLTAAVGLRRAGDMYFFDFDGNDAPGVPPPVPAVPPIRIPDVPRTLMSWRSSSLGVETETLGSQLAEFFGVKEGVLIRAVLKDSAAEKAGFKAGDVIVKVDGEKVTTPREISSLLRGSRVKKTFPVTVVRNRKEMTLNVTLEESGMNRSENPELL
jgi:serine protease Do